MIEFVVAGGAVALMLVAMGYNQIVRGKVHVREAWAQVAVQLQRRHDLVPRVVEAARAYAGHESDVLAAITRQRAAALTESDPALRPAAEDAFGAALARLVALAEQHPRLRADEHFAELADQLRETEDRLSFARRFANDRIASYLALTRSFPGNVLAKLFGFGAEELFALDDPRAAAVPGIELPRH